MKVVEMPKKAAEAPKHSGELLRYQLESSGVLDIEDGAFTLFFDTGDSVFIMTNGDGPGEVLLNIEKGKMAIMAGVYGGGDDNNES
jgi:hypothetical protein